MRRLVPAVVLCFLAACSPSTRGVEARSSGSIAVSHDDATLYVADADHDALVVLDARTLQVVRQVAVGARPERVMVSDDGAIFVTNRGGRSVTRLSAASLAVEATAPVGAEPVGMALSPDGKRLWVANSMSGTVSELDSVTLAKVREVAVGGQPWAIAVRPDGRTAYVTDFNGGSVLAVDLTTDLSVRLDLLQAPGAECQFGGGAARTPAQAADAVVSPDGERVYVAHVQSRTNSLAQGSLAFAVAPALSTVDTAAQAVLQEPARDAFDAQAEVQSAQFPPVILSTNLDQACRPQGGGMDAPSSLVVDGSGEWIFVADHNSNAVAVVSASRRADERFMDQRRGIYGLVRVGARPTGIAVATDLLTAWVHNALDYSISVVKNVDGALVEERRVTFGSSSLPAEVERGRRLFYSAVDARMTQPQLGGVSCSSCHPEGRGDGLNWQLPSRSSTWQAPTATAAVLNTKPLWGLAETAPYHWDGLVTALPAFAQSEVANMGGSGLASRDVADLTAFLATVRPPDNLRAELAAAGELTRGEQLFVDHCGTCHAGSAFTDRQLHPVGSQLSIDTPSLRGAHATPPYLHDGSEPSLRGAFTNGRFLGHDVGRRLGADDVRVLEAYVDTL